VALGLSGLRQALAAGAVKEGVHSVCGEVHINGVPARCGMQVKPGDVITTARNAELVAVMARDAYLVRGNTRVEFAAQATQSAASSLRLVTGALLSVFKPGGKRQILTPTSTICIRGTGIYIEAEATRTYVCTCYGIAELLPLDDSQEAETVRTKHHDQPRYIYAKGMPRMIEEAPVVNHTDAELVLLESLVATGRRSSRDLTKGG
jgi:ribosomal 50S subunit-recycling heat shock protein